MVQGGSSEIPQSVPVPSSHTLDTPPNLPIRPTNPGVEVYRFPPLGQWKLERSPKGPECLGPRGGFRPDLANPDAIADESLVHNGISLVPPSPASSPIDGLIDETLSGLPTDC